VLTLIMLLMRHMLWHRSERFALQGACTGFEIRADQSAGYECCQQCAQSVRYNGGQPFGVKRRRMLLLLEGSLEVIEVIDIEICADRNFWMKGFCKGFALGWLLGHLGAP
jgi:hypothetical protein